MSQKKAPIRVWRFDDAPAKYQRLSGHGGDEDWLAFVPDGQETPLWMDAGTPFGCYKASRRAVKGGWVVIGAHA